eukprot:GCRY01002933.1.p1 GENE.GCRY01002933.1~~GCRY01002933.1.p1  ORF type:complete len:352 (+),score=49.84 GCRY01002933.1:344-1399(+)
MENYNVTVLDCFDTVQSADVVEACPNHRNIFCCGTYQLQENGERTGLLHIFDTQDEKLNLLEKLNCDEAVFDVKWSEKQFEGKEILAVAGSLGNIFLFLWDSSLQKLASAHAFAEDVDSLHSAPPMCTGVNFAPALCSSSDFNLVTSKTDGSLSTLSFGGQSSLSVDRTWLAHNNEVWTAVFDSSNLNLVYSGSDDTRWKGWDLRMDLSFPTFTSKQHDGGVCTISPHPTHPHVLATGSYDDTLCLWDTRSIRRPLLQHNLGGGVWRIKWNLAHPDTALVCAMYNGFHVVRINPTVPEPSGLDVTASYFDMAEGSIAYGGDWLAADSAPARMAVCSFYDHKLSMLTSPLSP